MLWYNTITGSELHDHVHKIQHMSCKLSCSDKPEHLEDEDGCSSWAVFTLWVRAAEFCSQNIEGLLVPILREEGSLVFTLHINFDGSQGVTAFRQKFKYP